MLASPQPTSCKIYSQQAPPQNKGAGKRWEQKEFVISNWVDPDVPNKDMDSRIAEFAHANFTSEWPLHFDPYGNKQYYLQNYNCILTLLTALPHFHISHPWIQRYWAGLAPSHQMQYWHKSQLARSME